MKYTEMSSILESIVPVCVDVSRRVRYFSGILFIVRRQPVCSSAFFFASLFLHAFKDFYLCVFLANLEWPFAAECHIF